MKTMEILITPSIAQKMLDTMGPNRKIRENRVDQIANDLKNGCFTESNDLIAFDRNGHLINGQHRLSAIIKSEISLKTMIAYDMDPHSIIDMGAPRTLLDTAEIQESLHGDIASNRCVAIANTYLTIKMGASFRKMSASMKIDFIKENENEILLAQKIGKNGGPDKFCDRSGVKAAFLGAIFNGVDDSKLMDFSQCVNSGIIVGYEQSAASIVRRYLENTVAKSRGHVDSQASITELGIQDFIKGKPRTKMYVVGAHPYIK